MIRLVISNQRGGVAKTTTAVTLARVFADLGLRVLIVDTDAQGSVHQIIGARPEHTLHDFLITKLRLPDCVTKITDTIDLLASNRTTEQAEAALTNEVGREQIFDQLFSLYEDNYDAVIIDCAPSVSLFQNCGMVYARNVLIPVAMEALSIQGALASIQGAQYINKSALARAPKEYWVRPLALLPVMVNRRFALTDASMRSLEEISREYNITLLPAIRTDQNVAKAAKAKQFLQDFDPKSKALEDYIAAGHALMALTGYVHARSQAEATV